MTDRSRRFDDRGPADDERQARAQLRRQQRMQRGADRQRERQEQAAVAQAIVATSKLRCRCGLRRGMTRKDLRALGGGCSMPAHCCPRLDAVRRQVGL